MSERDDLLDTVRARLRQVMATGDPSLLLEAAAIADARHLAAGLTGQESHLETRRVLGWWHWYRYQALPEGEDQDDLVAAAEMFGVCFLAEIADEDLPEPLLPILAGQAVPHVITLLNQALNSADPDLLERGVRLWQRIVELTPADHPARGGFLANLGIALQERFERGGDPADLELAITSLREAVEIDHPDHAAMLSSLGSALRARFEHGDNLADLEEAITCLRQAVEITPPDHPGSASRLTNLGNALQVRFARTGDLADLDLAISYLNQALDSTPRDHTTILGNLAGALQARFARSGAVADLEQAINGMRLAVESAPRGNPARAARLSGLGNALQERFARTGDLADLEEAITSVRQAVEVTSRDHAEPAMISNNLGNLLLTRFVHTGALADLDEAITSLRQAAGTILHDHPGRAMHRSNLGNALMTRFIRTGDAADLEQAITVERQAVEATPRDHPDRAIRLSNLANALQARYDRGQALMDLQEAITSLRQAMEITPLDRRITIVNNLGTALLTMYERGAGPNDLEEAITHLRQAAEVIPPDHLDRTMILNNLGNALQTWYERSGIGSDLEEALTTQQLAVDSTPPDHPALASRLTNLGIALQTRHTHSGSPADLDRAISALGKAVQATPPDHPARAARLTNLGTAVQIRFEQSGHAADRDEAVDAYEEAARSAMGAPSQRIRAAHQAARLIVADSTRAAELLETAVRLLPEVSPRQLERSDQQHMIGQFPGLAADAAAYALADTTTPPGIRGQKALRLLEAGRAVLLSQTLHTRSDLSDLREHHPDLADRFMALRDRLDQPVLREGAGQAVVPMDWQATGSAVATMDRQATGQAVLPMDWQAVGSAVPPMDDRHRMAAELADVMERIRSLDGFASFALPPSIEELTEQATAGPVVTFNVSSLRSDALILTRTGISAVELPGLDQASLADRIDRFRQALSSRDDAVILDVLAWLWDVAAAPVLHELGLDAPPPGDITRWPRVWWAPGGLLTLLPIHAAGHHSADPDPHRRSVLDRVVSSYTPTITALRHARQHPTARTPPTGAERALIVAMPTTPGLLYRGPLPQVTREARLVADHLPGAVTLTEPPGRAATPPAETTPTKARVLTHLTTCAIAHFACHGLSDPTDPSASRLLLHDHQHDPLTVASLAPITLSHARLAYLSACSTALTSHTDLLDESIHLTSAFQMAGFPHVIGTLWEIADNSAVQIADTFYSTLTTDDGKADTRHTPYALHQSVQSLRHQNPLTPSQWAAHLHAGA
ncbi:CHAT domain-containing protein [Acrocarpospora pleiomorpha]|uniref:CHAT domain-containing tetratricopeptide repeat protein n=1 Tax=Acrocarpospora pleiomorpha TaxID=90975 RepID=UPI0012D33B17|nr:CHAT domain-containing tetratricopeptide repeat protein [Acrocarpospora pleiomorpha]